MKKTVPTEVSTEINSRISPDTSRERSAASTEVSQERGSLHVLAKLTITRRPRIYAQWKEIDGKLVCQWIGEE